MVSDTPSQPPKKQENNEEHQTSAENVTQDTSGSADGPAAPKENDEAVKTAMADVAAAIKRHEEHGSEDNREEASGDTDEDDVGSERSNARPAQASEHDADQDAGKTADKDTLDQQSSVEEKPERNKAGLIPLLAAGVAGGAVVLVGGLVLQSFGLLGGAQNGSIEARFESGMNELREQINGMASGSNQAASASAAAVSQLQEDVATLQKKLQSVSEAASKAASSSGSASGASPELQKTVSDLEAEIASLKSSLTSDTGTVQSLQSGLSDLKGSLSSQADQLNGKIAALEKKIDQPGKDLIVARAIAAAGLSSAIDRGGSFARELKTYRQVSPDDAALQQLSDMAASGIPTREQLTSQFTGLADSIIRAADQPAQDEGVVRRLISSAKGLITVRPVGNVEGDSTPAIVARIENDLKIGELQKAANEWNKLPAASKEVSSSFETALNARITADTLVAKTLQQAIGSMTGQAGQPDQAN
ncbi:COG4223 family protein [Martelella mediterranea]|uniref:Inner membrane protein n=1 Tax=Martelella mediterranea TaxID=293089 RepID=A0A4R3NX66_9HYPH|nr:mitofilin family membrane protein [Martelella mediterranea]TCT42706.1 hypothetical protein EDC90_10045 [Martelella mediterranea]